MFSIIIVEDDFMQRDILKKMILSIHEFIEIYEADSENTALDIIEQHYINMFLIDISLKESSGLDLAVKIRNIDKYQFNQIIFLTTHMEYITQAFKQIHCYDYIMKPYNQEDVQAMLSKLICYENSRLNNSNDNLEKNIDKELIIKIRSSIFIRVKINDILFIEVNGRNCEVNTVSGSYTYINISLKKILELINCEQIIQSHKAFAVNINYIFKVEKLDFRLRSIYFKDCSKTALLGNKFKNNIIPYQSLKG